MAQTSITMQSMVGIISRAPAVAIRQSGDIVLHSLEFCDCSYYFSQGCVATHCRCGGKYDMDLVANLLLSLTVK